MVLEINNIKDKTPHLLSFKYEATLSESLNLTDRNATFDINGKVSKEGNIYICELTANTLLSATCDLCLEHTPFPLEFTFSESFSRESDENTDIIHLENNTINLVDVLMAGLYVSLPPQFICSDTCEGLCKDCGTNLNKQTCNCHEKEKETDPRFDALKNIQWR